MMKLKNYLMLYINIYPQKVFPFKQKILIGAGENISLIL